MNVKKVFSILVGLGLTGFLLIQLVPVNRVNPPITKEPDWGSPEARALIKENCFQCHSNETEWPWYSYVAPASWLIRWDVKQGRRHVNFSEWDKPSHDLDDMIRMIELEEMPPIQYTIFHPEAKLDAQEKQALIEALTISLGE